MIGWLGKQGLSKEMKLELVLSVSHCGQGLGKEPSRWKVQSGETLLRTGSRPGCWSGESKGCHHWGDLSGPWRPGKECSGKALEC